MSVFSGLPLKEPSLTKVFEIDVSLYEKLEHLSRNVYDVSINKLVMLCIEEIIRSKNVVLFRRPQNEITVTRSFLIKKSLYKELTNLKIDCNLSYNRLINIAIRNVLVEENLIKK